MENVPFEESLGEMMVNLILVEHSDSPRNATNCEKVARIGPLPKAEVENETGRFVNKVGVLKLRIVGHVERMIDCESPYRRLDTLAVQHA